MSPFAWFLSGYGFVILVIAAAALTAGVPVGQLALGVIALLAVGALVGWLRERRANQKLTADS